MQNNEFYPQLARTHIDTVYRLALSCTRSSADADDVTQEVFLRLLRTSKGFESDEHAKNWLMRVTVNECKRVWKRARSAERLEDYADKLTFSSEENGELFRLVMGLPHKYRAPIHLHYYEGYSTAEIARVMNIPPSTVRTRLERGRKRLKELWAEAEHV